VYTARIPIRNSPGVIHAVYIKVQAPARLHLGFLDLNGSCGRKFGSLGLAIEDIGLTLTAWRSPTIKIGGPDAERAEPLVARLLEVLNVSGGVSVRIEESIPAHAGLGSGTQMALALGSALAGLFGVEVDALRLAEMSGRGSRSGIGIGVFRAGGLIVDGGRGAQTAPPPVISRLPVPDNWRFLLVLDRDRQGLHGEHERRAFDTLGRMDDGQAAELCRMALMQALPAAAENDCAAFGAAITGMQQRLGAFFAGPQNGAYTSPRVAAAITGLLARGAAGGGQTSWGPTGFAIYPSETEGFQALRRARREYRNQQALEFQLCRPRNRPAEITRSETLPEALGERRQA
jgi:beta-RFAP synthase